MNRVVIITLLVKICNILNYGATSFTNTHRNHNIKEVYLEDEFVEKRINEEKQEIEPDFSLLKGTLEKTFRKIPPENLIPAGTKMTKGKIMDRELEEARYMYFKFVYLH